ncbi:MAG: S8 family serine peptidase [Bacteroidetes bacterium]|nr:S8 family serine peptidase [Bacteroidota bacterium]
MKSYLIIIFSSLLICNISHAQQNNIATALEKAIKAKDNENKYLKINIILREQANLDSLQAVLIKNNVAVKQRPEIVRQFLMQHAANTQKQLIQFIRENDEDAFISIQPLWIINMLVVEAKPALIQKLAERKDIDFVDLDNSYLVNPVEPPVNTQKSMESLNGKELGLVAINAPALWAMGYTGRGRIAGSVDTGVWPAHPAIKNNFLGNYLPLNRCWYPYHSDVPVDKTGSHGTHTVGTEMGLDRSTNDTIGVAYNAFFIATDPVATSISTVKPLSAFLLCFQWMLNPDGDTATTDDVPDVLNNSWGYTVATDTLLCNSFITQLFNAYEAAGIAVVFSAGNDGPDPQTIPYPQHVVASEVNPFTVGSINGNNSSYLISSFSSRGPTICDAVGNLKIKPEVVAPGENVRSSVEQNAYATYSGTSMAGPHATGAVLLLKEAFPNVSGHDILYALYMTAHDLGTAGEDNTYGRGIIDVLAAFNYLAQTHTPTPPLAQTFDIAIREIINPTLNYYCTKSFTPKVVITNLGDSILHSAKIYYRLNNETEHQYQWTGNLHKYQLDSITLATLTAASNGDYELKVRIVNDSNGTEYNKINNNSIARFNIREEKTLPFYEDFEAKTLKQAGWIINNPDYNKTWDTVSTGGIAGSTTSMYINLASYSPSSYQKDEAISPVLVIPDSLSVTMKFQVAYFYANARDTLSIYASDNCGSTFPYLLYKKGGDNLVTTSSAAGLIPAASSDWRQETVNISQIKNKKVIIKFESTNDNGNSIFIDNLQIYAGSNIYVPEINNSTVIKLYPNPFNSNINIEFKTANLSNISIDVLDILGKEIKKLAIANKKEGNISIDLNDLKSGVYIVRFSNENSNSYFKIIKK